MSCSGGPVGSGRFDPCGCDPEKVFEYADKGDSPEGLGSEQEKEMREHLASCSECRELYERELDLNAFLSFLVFRGFRPRGTPVNRGGGGASQTGPGGARIFGVCPPSTPPAEP